LLVFATKQRLFDDDVLDGGLGHAAFFPWRAFDDLRFYIECHERTA
jgi:hypothetical protein